MSNQDVILKIENVSKQYRLGVISTGTISHDLNRWWHKVRGKEDPFLKIGESNDRATKGESEYVWALKDINFEVQRGEVLGIIGKNGAGKSTLLKILSRVTGPTTGSIKSRGRIASLLEVGTGFHPELTGKENVFLNGAILGMTKAEIEGKLDEIVEFSGCERYIDTPVKRYSSGMRVRLAFAVAAFLEPDILVVDEVLAVGDAEFQKKAIGKMKDISKGGGRTVLFVSHNMASVKSLCNRGIILENGLIHANGNINEMIKLYLGGDSEFINFRKINQEKDDFFLQNVAIGNVGSEFKEAIVKDKEIFIEFNYDNKTRDENLYWNIKIKDDSGNYLIGTSSLHSVKGMSKGIGKSRMIIPSNFFNEGSYSFDIRLMSKKKGKGYKDYFNEKDVLMINIIPDERPMGSWMGRAPESINPKFDWI